MGESVRVSVAEMVPEGVTLGVGVADAVSEAVDVSVVVADGLGVEVALRVPVAVGDPVAGVTAACQSRPVPTEARFRSCSL